MLHKISIASDHAGYLLKEILKEHLKQRGYTFFDKGCYSDERADYPDFGHAAAIDVQNGSSNLAIIICGSGNGINMSANKHKNIRSALCWNSEIAKLARAHNNANVLALPARFITEQEAKLIVDSFLETKFEGGRHSLRVEKINC